MRQSKIAQTIVALAHRILVIAFAFFGTPNDYQERGGDYFDRMNPTRTRDRLVPRLQRLGLEVEARPSL